MTALSSISIVLLAYPMATVTLLALTLVWLILRPMLKRPHRPHQYHNQTFWRAVWADMSRPHRP